MNYLRVNVINCCKCFHCCVAYDHQLHSSFTHMSHFRRLACKMARIALRVHGNYSIPREHSILCSNKFAVLCVYRSPNWEIFSDNLCAFVFHCQPFHFSASLRLFELGVVKCPRIQQTKTYFVNVYDLIELNCRLINFVNHLMKDTPIKIFSVKLWSQPFSKSFFLTFFRCLKRLPSLTFSVCSLYKAQTRTVPGNDPTELHSRMKLKTP